MKFLDRILTIVITATVTSMIWIVAGGSLIENATSGDQIDQTRPAEAEPSPSPTEVEDEDADRTPQPGESARVLDTETASQPTERENAQLLVPVLNVRPSDLSDTFTDARGGGVRLHEAIDIMAPKGTTVRAAAAGTIEKLFQSAAGGKTIYVRSDDRKTIHYYAHLDEYAEGLREGQKIRRGQRIGTVGSSGNASEEAPHLHFAILRTTADAEWWEPANAVNPYPLLSGSR
ncbi:M23 family metallopeptidase [Erythrobacter litoralis]|uniref:M23ase beta-sheet core domain-containing protein n=1 Tax=Erythrobacter litoralis (strain HTCC2594) TaxID=314225 RepID=Q2NAZ8_ERYLH|nr:M23 family metallopeptidase [Erythrobacter litoralis]ABC63143.1 hypothetical protein ELI_05255 [Erythrobacter litoralis HTCC2594]